MLSTELHLTSESNERTSLGRAGAASAFPGGMTQCIILVQVFETIPATE